METLSIQMQPFFEWLLRTTLQTSLLICLILSLQTILRSRLGVRWHYGLWLVLLLRMAMPWTPESRVSVFNLLPQSIPQRQFEHAIVPVGDVSADSIVASADTSESTPISDRTVAQKKPEPVTITPQPTKEAQGPAKSTFPKFVAMFPLVWLTGALVLAAYICASNFYLWWLVTRERPLTDQKILDLLEDCKSRMGIRTILGVVTTDKVKSPALFGFVRPRLLLPEGMIEALSREELRYVFLHELAHLKRHDIYIGWLVSLLQILHWFNPLVWLAFYRLRSDRELACDALVLARTQSEEPKSYGRIIVNLVERFSRPRCLPGMAGILETKAQLKRRVTMITRFKKNSYQWSPLSVILIVILGCVSLPDAISTKASQTSATESAPPIAIRRVWAGPDVAVEGEVSPDGRYISYTDWDTGDLAVYEITTGKKRRLTNKGTWDESDEFAEFSRWSPDSKQIVYDWYNKDRFIELRIVGLDGSEPQILYRNKDVTWAQTYDWSHDGKQILACFSAKDGDQIVLVSVADGSVRFLKTVNMDYLRMVFSPDGRYIVYEYPQKESCSESDIFLLSADGSGEIPLIEHPADDRVLDWTPDGKNFLFTSDRTGSSSIWSITIADGMVQGKPKLVKPDIGQGITSMGFTQDGSFYYDSGGEGISDVYTTKVDPETGKVLTPPTKAIQRFEGHNRTPDYSLDGKYMAYVTNRGRQQILCIHSLETGQEREFPSKLRRILDPRWSPDGNSILIAGMDYNINRAGHYQVDLKTGIFTPVLLASKGFRLYSHEWSSDGKSFFLGRTSRKDRQRQIILREIGSGKEKKIYHAPRAPLLERFCLACSPDGKWLAFTIIHMRRNDGALMIIPSAGGEPRELYRCEPKKEQFITLRWTPDGKYILFVIEEIEQKKRNLWRIPVEGGQPQKIDLGINITDLSVHPDGRHIALGTRQNEPSEVWAMENFLLEGPTAKSEGAREPTLRRIEVRGRGRIHSQPSFDGRYMSDVDDTGNLVVRELATGKERNLTKKDSWPESKDFAHRSLISPDGTKVAYSWFNAETEDFDLRVVGFDGSDDRLLWGSEEGARAFNIRAWSPDGRYIFGEFVEQNDQLMRISVEDGSRQIVRTFDGKGLSKVDVSSDGRYVAYAVADKTTSNRDIFVFDLETNEETPLVEHSANDKLLGWTPDGQHIFFASDRNGTWDGWLVQIVDGKPYGIPEVVKPGIGNVVPVGFTRNGSFYYAFQHEAWNVYTAALDSNTGQVTSDPEPLRHVGRDIRPDWSPDGRYIAYLSEIDRSKPQIIRIRTLATGRERELKIDIPRFDWLRWCPDSRHLLITSFNRGSPSVVYRLDAQTGEYTALLKSDEQRIRQAELSADGKTLAYRIRGMGNANRLIVRDMETGREKELLRTDVMDAAYLSPFASGWTLSPDGKQVALSVREGEGDEPLKPLVLKVLSITSGELKTLVGAPVGELAWTRDGSSLLFVKDLAELWCVSAKGGEPRRLWKWKQMIWGPRIHPEGQRIAFFSGGYVSEMWVMENFLPTTIASAVK